MYARGGVHIVLNSRGWNFTVIMTIKIYKLITTNNDSTTPSYRTPKVRGRRVHIIHCINATPAGPRRVYYYIKCIYTHVYAIYTLYNSNRGTHNIILYIYIHTYIHTYVHSMRVIVRALGRICVYGARSGCGGRKMR